MICIIYYMHCSSCACSNVWYGAYYALYAFWYCSHHHLSRGTCVHNRLEITEDRRNCGLVQAWRK